MKLTPKASKALLRPEASGSFDVLPDHIVQLVLSQSKVVGCGSDIFPHVCNRFRRLYAEASFIWGHTSLCAWRDGPLRRGSAHDDHTLRRLHWLAPRASSIRSCELHGWSGPLANQLFATLTGMIAAGEAVVGLATCDCDFSPRVFDSLLLLPALESLKLELIVGSVESGHLGMVLESLTRLTSLELDWEWSEKGSITAGFPAGLLACTRLRRLLLTNAGDAAIPALPDGISRLQTLDHLILYDCGVTEVPDTFTQLTTLTRLGIFQFHRSSATEVAALRVPAGLPAMTQLRELGLSLTSWQPLLKQMTYLTRLMVRHIATHADARQFMAAFHHLRPLRTLELSSDADLAAAARGSTAGEDDDSVIQWQVPQVDFY